MKNKNWKIYQRPDFKYLRLGNKHHNHIVFKITTDKQFQIMVGKKDNSISRININNEAIKVLKDWLLLNLPDR